MEYIVYVVFYNTNKMLYIRILGYICNPDPFKNISSQYNELFYKFNTRSFHCCPKILPF